MTCVMTLVGYPPARHRQWTDYRFPNQIRRPYSLRLPTPSNAQNLRSTDVARALTR